MRSDRIARVPVRGRAMEFGYFTLSDNHYENNTRTSNQFIADITDEALYADEIACIPHGSANITSTRSASFLAQT
jgi:hypothetical protein